MKTGMCWKAFAVACALAITASLGITGLCARRTERETADVYLRGKLGYSSRPVGSHGQIQGRRSTRAPGQGHGRRSHLVAYGDDMNLVRRPDGETHDEWWSAMSLAGVLNVLDEFYKSGSATSPVLESATKHWDECLVSRYYNWHPGSWKGAYTHAASYKLKADAPPDAVRRAQQDCARTVFRETPRRREAIHEYEIDTEAIHTEAPGTFWVDVISPNADGLDKLNAALRERAKTNPLGGPAFESMVDSAAHRDSLSSSTVTYK